MLENEPSNNSIGTLRTTVLVLFWIEFCLTSWLCVRQIQKIAHQTEIPPALTNFTYDIYDFQVSGRYVSELLLLTIFKKIYLTICWTLLIVFDGVYIGWILAEDLNSELDFLPDFIDATIRQNALFALFCVIIKQIVLFPVAVYTMMYVEKAFGFYSRSWKHWLRDFLKAHLYETITLTMLMTGLTWLVQTMNDLFINGYWIQIILMGIVYWLLFPSICVARLLRKRIVPLDDGELKVRIHALAERVGFPKENVFISSSMTGTTHSNAFYYGFLNYHRLVIFSTVIEGYHDVPNGLGLPPALVEAVVAHELGHYKMFHGLYQNTLAQLDFLAIFLTSMWLVRKESIFKAFGFPDSDSAIELKDAILPGMLVASQFILRFPLMILNKMFHWANHELEYAADGFAVSLGYGTKLQKALVKISVDNCIYPDADYFYAMFYLTHPTMVERIININAYSPTIQK